MANEREKVRIDGLSTDARVWFNRRALMFLIVYSTVCFKNTQNLVSKSS